MRVYCCTMYGLGKENSHVVPCLFILFLPAYPKKVTMESIPENT